MGDIAISFQRVCVGKSSSFEVLHQSCINMVNSNPHFGKAFKAIARIGFLGILPIEILGGIELKHHILIERRSVPTVACGNNEAISRQNTA